MKFLKLNVYEKLSLSETHTVVLNADQIEEMQAYDDGTMVSKKDGRMLYVSNTLEELTAAVIPLPPRVSRSYMRTF